MYGGAHYTASAACTLQGKAIRSAAKQWGDGRTLSFTPCKRGFVPIKYGKDGMQLLCACSIHHAQRWRRLFGPQKKHCDFATMCTGKIRLRPGEVDPRMFWETSSAVQTSDPVKEP